MSFVFTPPTDTSPYLKLAVFHLNDLCVAVQEEMDDYLTTASLEKMPGVEATFQWLRRREVRLCLLSDYQRQDTLRLLDRLGWTVDEQGTVQEVITQQNTHANPVRIAQELAGLDSERQSVLLADTPRLLACGKAAGVHLNIGVCNGRSAYYELAAAPHHTLLDTLLQLPNFLLEHLAVAREVHNRGARTRVRGLLPRLKLPLPLSWG